MGGVRINNGGGWGLTAGAGGAFGRSLFARI